MAHHDTELGGDGRFFLLHQEEKEGDEPGETLGFSHLPGSQEKQDTACHRAYPAKASVLHSKLKRQTIRAQEVGLMCLGSTHFCLRRSSAASLNTGCWQSTAQEVRVRSRQELQGG